MEEGNRSENACSYDFSGKSHDLTLEMALYDGVRVRISVDVRRATSGELYLSPTAALTVSRDLRRIALRGFVAQYFQSDPRRAAQIKDELSRMETEKASEARVDALARRLKESGVPSYVVGGLLADWKQYTALSEGLAGVSEPTIGTFTAFQTAWLQVAQRVCAGLYTALGYEDVSLGRLLLTGRKGDAEVAGQNASQN